MSIFHLGSVFFCVACQFDIVHIHRQEQSFLSVKMSALELCLYFVSYLLRKESPTILVQVISCSSGTLLFLLFTLPLRETSCHATPRMAAFGCAFRIGARAQGARPPSEKCSCSPWKFCGPLAFSSQSPPCPLFQRLQPHRHARGCCLGGGGRDLEVGSSDQGQPAPGPGNPQSFLETFGVDSVFPDDRARQRVMRAQDVIDKAIAQKKLFEEEVAKGERRPKCQSLRKCVHKCQFCRVRSMH